MSIVNKTKMAPKLMLDMSIIWRKIVRVKVKLWFVQQVKFVLNNYSTLEKN